MDAECILNTLLLGSFTEDQPPSDYLWLYLFAFFQGFTY